MKKSICFALFLVFISLPLISCSNKTEQAHTNHEGHEAHQHKVDEKKADEIQIFENGRVLLFEREAPHIDLVDQNNQRVTSEDLKGKVVLINFIYTNCEESCPVMVHKFMDIARKLGEEMGRSIQLVSITMDPERDTPEKLKKYAEGLKADTSKWMFLTGEKETVDSVLKGFQFTYMKNEDGSFVHANGIMALDRNGVWRYQFNVLTDTVDIVIDRIKELV